MKTKKISIFNKVFISFLVVITFSLMITLADLFSSLITVGGFTFTSDSVNFSKYTVYGISISSHKSLQQANESSNICISQGGAGYVLLEDKYYVIASIYENEADAEKVKESLAQTKPETQVLTIEVPPITLSSNFTAQEKTITENCLSSFKNTYKKLYDLSVGLDTGISSEINVRLSINSLASEINTLIGNFNTVFATTSATKLLSIKECLLNLSKSLDALISTTKTPLTSYIKKSYCETIFNYKSLANSINE